MTFIDLGCSFDMLCRGVNTRAWIHSVDEELAYYRDLLPEGW